MHNFSKERYSGELFEDWAVRKGIIPAEEYLLKKYLTDFSKSVIEAGTGGGRISFYIENMGFQNITAFDYVPKMIEHARSVAKEKKSLIKFQVADASDLPEYENSAFDYLIYLQQVLCFVPKELFFNSCAEAYRIAKKGGIVIFSFLDWNSRIYNPTLSWVTNTIRKIRREEVLKQHLPWLKLNGKFNWKLFNKNQPTVFWIKKNEIISDLKNIGFSILEAKNNNQLFNDSDKTRKEMLYIVCRK